ncbi:MAG: hypothetical protein JWL98_1562 [Xanthomonadaceae bacterium]|nr:hypothetical protein [Xanthomonadaceae bacterium]
MPNRKNNQEQGRESGNRGSDQGRGRGFAGMDPQQQREIASEGGRAAHASGHAHEFTPEEAREAGRKGGEARSNTTRNRSGSSDRDIQAEGGESNLEGRDRSGS